MFGFNSISANAISSVGAKASQNAMARIAVGPAFSRGFNSGYAKGPFLVGTATITQDVINVSSHFNAKGTVEKIGLASLPVVVSTNFDWAITALLESQLSFSSNSVLLLGGTASIVPSAQVAGSLTSPLDNADTIDLILYLIISVESIPHPHNNIILLYICSNVSSSLVDFIFDVSHNI